MSEGARLPYLLAKLKAPRMLERLETTAERARSDGWSYEQFLEALWRKSPSDSGRGCEPAELGADSRA